MLSRRLSPKSKTIIEATHAEACSGETTSFANCIHSREWQLSLSAHVHRMLAAILLDLKPFATNQQKALSFLAIDAQVSCVNPCTLYLARHRRRHRSLEEKARPSQAKLRCHHRSCSAAHTAGEAGEAEGQCSWTSWGLGVPQEGIRLPPSDRQL